MECVNNFHGVIEFASENFRDKVCFLDVMVSRKRLALETDLFCKPTDTNHHHSSIIINIHKNVSSIPEQNVRIPSNPFEKFNFHDDTIN